MDLGPGVRNHFVSIVNVASVDNSLLLSTVTCLINWPMEGLWTIYPTLIKDIRVQALTLPTLVT